MTRGQIWPAQVGRKRRPVLVPACLEVVDAWELFTVAEVTTSFQGLAAVGRLDHDATGLDRPSARTATGSTPWPDPRSPPTSPT